jgi:SAM-dependent methyltransferase
MSLFDRHAPTYRQAIDSSIGFIGQDSDFFTQLKASELLEVMSRCIGAPSTLEVLDVGCGVGATDSFLLPCVGRLAGVDVSTEMLDLAAAANPGATYRESDGETIPFEDGSFDFSFAVCVAHHVPPAKRTEFVRELVRVTRPSGAIAIAEHNPYNPLTRLAVARCQFDDGVVLVPMRTATRLLEAAGAPVVDRRYIAFFPFRGATFRTIERKLSRVMLGAQYIVAARPARRS